MFFKFRQGDLAHGRRRRQRRSTNGTKACTGCHSAHGHAAAPVTNHGVAGFKKSFGQAPVCGELSHQQKQGYHR